MAEENAAQDPSTPDAAPAPTEETQQPPAKKPRSAIERFIIWGGIAVLLIIAVTEYRAKINFEDSYKKLTAAFEESKANNDSSTEHSSLTKSQVEQQVKGYSKYQPNLSGVIGISGRPQRLDTYTFAGFLMKRVIYVYYRPDTKGEEPEVADITDQEH